MRPASSIERPGQVIRAERPSAAVPVVIYRD